MPAPHGGPVSLPVHLPDGPSPFPGPGTGPQKLPFIDGTAWWAGHGGGTGGGPVWNPSETVVDGEGVGVGVTAVSDGHCELWSGSAAHDAGGACFPAWTATMSRVR